MIFKIIKIHRYEAGLYFRDGEFRGLLEPGRHWFFDPLGRVKVEVVSQRAPWLAHEKLDVIVKSGALEGRALVLDLKDYERALVWIDGRPSSWSGANPSLALGGCQLIELSPETYEAIWNTGEILYVTDAGTYSIYRPRFHGLMGWAPWKDSLAAM